MSNISWWKHVSAIIRKYHVPRNYAERIARYPQYAKDIIYEYRREKRRRYEREQQMYREAERSLKLTQIEQKARERMKFVHNQIRNNRIRAIKRRLEITDDPQEYKRLKTLEFVYDNKLDEGYIYDDTEKRELIMWDKKNRELLISPYENYQ